MGEQDSRKKVIICLALTLKLSRVWT